jgi:hypothetical protein
MPWVGSNPRSRLPTVRLPWPATLKLTTGITWRSTCQNLEPKFGPRTLGMRSADTSHSTPKFLGTQYAIVGYMQLTAGTQTCSGGQAILILVFQWLTYGYTYKQTRAIHKGHYYEYSYSLLSSVSNYTFLFLIMHFRSCTSRLYYFSYLLTGLFFMVHFRSHILIRKFPGPNFGPETDYS